jgi:hypothetical protein
MNMNNVFKTLENEMDDSGPKAQKGKRCVLVVMPKEKDEIVIYGRGKGTVKDLRRAMDDLGGVNCGVADEAIEKAFRSSAEDDLFNTIDEANLPDEVKDKVKKMTSELFKSL